MVAERLKDVPAVYTGNDRDWFAKTLFSVALEMGHGLDGANSVLRAAMAVEITDLSRRVPR